MQRTFTLGIGAILSMALAAPYAAEACSRAVYFGEDGQTVTGRTMDWFVSDMDTNLWLYPRGLERFSNTATPIIWKAKYGSVVTTIYEGASADGMNEAGLVANMLYLAESEYPPATEGDTRPTLPISAWAQYVLDNFATTAEAVEALGKEEFRIVPITAPTGEKGTVHLSISDATGDSAIFEYIGGKLVIHHGREFQIMTNSPTYDQQLALAAYWKNIGGSVMLPGTNRAADRFARMSYYINEATQTADPRRAVATVFSVMRNVSVPIGIKIPGQPNIADTLWLTVSDQKNRIYYYQDTNSPSIIWANLNALDFSEGSLPRKVQLDGNPDLAGDQTANFQPAELFKFMSPDESH
ncbi:linear amide C-N hydrolase [Tabrizicola sp. J26]|uniref:linear amide C-N hydrolase n=1 Tax=Alitabrizicola rongguiensis TaxID=2909234 RepID=UPI001F1E53D7|nr:linear amide C-N hydrolase [Tabrizicola rongguiensis]MCF1709758.1 linear amide C-N hydrolase [Tabrizicola rongguiensis]